MKILYFSNSTIPSKTANSVHVMKMCQAFAANGCSVSLAAAYGNHPSNMDLFDYYGCNKAFNILFTTSLAGKTKRFAHIFKGIIYLLRGKPDLVYTRNIHFAIITSFLRYRTILELHAPLNSKPFASWLLSLTCKNNSSLQKVTVISESLKNLILSKHYWLKERIEVHHDGADEVKDQNSNIKKGRKRFEVAYIGSMYKGRGIDLIMGLAKLLPDFKFILVGGPESEYNRYKSNSDQLSNIEYFGYKNQTFVVNIMQESDILLAPYQNKVHLTNGKGETSAWMSPLKIFEYMASGTPLIASDLPVLKEVLKDGKNSLLCPPEEINAWEAAIKKLCSSEELRNRLSNDAKKEIQEKYSWKIRAKSILQNTQI